MQRIWRVAVRACVRCCAHRLWRLRYSNAPLRPQHVACAAPSSARPWCWSRPRRPAGEPGEAAVCEGDREGGGTPANRHTRLACTKGSKPVRQLPHGSVRVTHTHTYAAFSFLPYQAAACTPCMQRAQKPGCPWHEATSQCTQAGLATTRSLFKLWHASMHACMHACMWCAGGTLACSVCMSADMALCSRSRITRSASCACSWRACSSGRQAKELTV